MSIEKEQFESLCAAYALGIIEPDEQTLLDEALASGDEEFQSIFRESAGVSHFINSGVKRAVPSPHVRSRMIKQIQFGDRTPSSIVLLIEKFAITLGFGRPGFGLLVAALLLIVIAEIGAYAYVMYSDLDATVSTSFAVETLAADQEKRLQHLTSELEKKNEVLDVLQSPKLEVAMLTGQDAHPSGFGKIIWDPARKIAILHVFKLPSLPSGMVYHVWLFDKNKKATSAGTFSLSDSTDHIIQVSEMPLPDQRSEISAISVTMEPATGVTQPSGTVFLFGSTVINNER
ncbi:MAG: anti-sigma factor [Bacteriovoracaceae bacterium]|nr:anti-sigma factor [Bacteroidota bacterium]